MHESFNAETVSPELVLVDPDLAARAEVLASDGVGPGNDEIELLIREIEDDTEAAIRRIVELSDVEPPSVQRRFRVTKLVGAFATWAVVGILAVETLRAV